MSPVAVKAPANALPLEDKLPNPTSPGLSMVQFKVTEPELPPPDIPVPAVTPVMSPVLLVYPASLLKPLIATPD